MKITKKVREEAALLLSVAACTPANIASAATAMGASESARELAHDAFYDRSVPFLDPWHATYAAAEQLLRSGWSPP